MQSRTIEILRLRSIIQRLQRDYGTEAAREICNRALDTELATKSEQNPVLFQFSNK